MEAIKYIVLFTVFVPLGGGIFASLIYLLSLIFGGI